MTIVTSLYRLLSVVYVIINVVQCQECAFISGLYDTPLDAVNLVVDCRQSITHQLNVHTNQQNVSSLVVNLVGCSTITVGLFVNITASFALTAADLRAVNVSTDSTTTNLSSGSFWGLGYVRELRLYGFSELKYLSRDAFEPLRRLETLILVEFGSNLMNNADIGATLSGLSGTPLTTLVLHRLISVTNQYKSVYIDQLVPLTNVSIATFVLSDSVTIDIKGRLSKSLPNLTYACIASDARYNTAFNFVLDSLFSHPSLEEIIYYAYPINAATPDPQPGVDDDYSRNILHTLDDDVLRVLSSYPRSGCYWGFELPVNPRLRRIVCHKVRFLETKVATTFCIHDSNRVAYFDLTGSPMPPDMPLMTGLNTHLRYYSLRRTGLQRLPADFFKYMPNIEVLLLSENQIRGVIENANGSFFGHCRTLRVLDLSDCGLSKLPVDLFTNIASLTQLNLSRNDIALFDSSLADNVNITLLNLSANAIKQIADEVIGQLKDIARRRADEGDALVVDLTDPDGTAPLSCLCNASSFVDWVVTSAGSRKVRFPNFDGYKCLYPDGSVRLVSSVNATELIQRCQVVSTLVNNSDCSCDADLRDRLRLVQLSLDSLFCRNTDGALVSMAFSSSSCRNVFASAEFIAPVAVASLLVVAFVVAVVLLYRERNNRRLKPIVDCLDMNRLVRIAMQYLMVRNHRGEEDEQMFAHDVFVFVHHVDETRRQIQQTIIDSLSADGKTRRFITDQNIVAGSRTLDALNEITAACRRIVVVLTPNFVADPFYLDYVSRVLHRRPHAIVPVVWIPIDVDDFADNDTIVELYAVADPLRWPGDIEALTGRSEETNSFWAELRRRIDAAKTSSGDVTDGVSIVRYASGRVDIVR